jgi:hypothetical protein
MDPVVGILVVVALLFLLWGVCSGCRTKDSFGLDDQNYALSAMEANDRATFLKGDLVPGASMPPSLAGAEDVLQSVMYDPGQKIYEDRAGIGLGDEDGIGYANPQREELTFFPEVDTRSWNYYHYNFPFQYSDGTDPYPENLYTRMRYIQPYDVANLSWGRRPGTYFPKALRNRWLRNNDHYYMINNGDVEDRMDDGW